MPDPILIVVTGLPCSGKTVLAEKISKEFGLPLLTKDGLKEILFDTLGWSDRAWGKKLSRASNRMLLHIAGAMLSAGQSLIIESNFSPEEFSGPFQELRAAVVFTPIQILCYADGEELVFRFRKRWEAGQRHPGHMDDQSFAEISQTLLAGKLAPLDLGGDLIEIDTTDFDHIDLPGLFSKINRLSGLKTRKFSRKDAKSAKDF